MSVASPKLRLRTADLEIPIEFDALEAERDARRTAGLYLPAAALQSELALAKRQQERKFQDVMLDRHHVATEALQRSQAAEHMQQLQKWDTKLRDLAQLASQQEAELLERHARERDVFQQSKASQVPRPKWSSELLNTRKIEEYLIRQHDLHKAAMVKAGADIAEVEEARAKEDEYWVKVACEEHKLLQRHAREMQALQMRSTMTRDEAVLARDRELERIGKRFQVERSELLKAQALERQDLETALKGWYNLNKVGLGPSPLVPASPMCISLMSPTAKLTHHRDLSPVRRSRPSSLPSLPNSPCGDRAAQGADGPSPSHETSGQSGEGFPAIPQALKPKSKGPGVSPIIIAAPRAATPSQHLDSESRSSSGSLYV